MALQLLVQLIALCTHASAGWCWKCIELESESLLSDIRKWKWQRWLCDFSATCTDVQLGALCTHTLLNTMIDLWHLFYSSSKKQETKITQTKRHKQNTRTKTRFSIQQWFYPGICKYRQEKETINIKEEKKKTTTKDKLREKNFPVEKSLIKLWWCEALLIFQAFLHLGRGVLANYLPKYFKLRTEIYDNDNFSFQW